MPRTVGVVLVLIALSGCAGYRPKPIVPRDVLADLQRTRLEALQPPAQALPPALAGGFDLTDGLSNDEAAAIALFANPALRAFRKERGVAEGELVAASLLPNPELEVTWLAIENFTRSFATGGFDVGIRWAPPRPGERAAKRARAGARINEVLAQIADEEWRLASDVRKAHTAVLAAQEGRRLAEAALALQERVRKFLRDKRDLGDASRLEVNLIELEYLETFREREAILREETVAHLELRRLLGLPPEVPVTLQSEAAPLGYRPFALRPEVLEAVLIDRRADIVAARQEYEQAEQSLRFAYIQRMPWPRFGPTFERDGSPGEGAINKFGLSVGIELPIAHLNQGEIARLDAARDKLREGFVARVHAARAEVHHAYAALLAQERLVRTFRDVIAPALNESAELAAAALEVGDVNVLQFVTTQSKLLRGRRELTDAHLEYWKAVFELERALASRLHELDGRQEWLR